MYGFKILCEISKGTFEISHKIWTQTPQNLRLMFSIFACELRYLWIVES